jgi:hypothetical protein
MNFRQIVVLVITGLFLVGVGARAFGLLKERNAAVQDLRTLQEKDTTVEQDKTRIDSENQFLANPDNLEKELKARFNYHQPGEKEIILVPPEHPTSATSTP